jgi:hypothetical protein
MYSASIRRPLAATPIVPTANASTVPGGLPYGDPVLNPPAGLRPDTLSATLAEGWGVSVASLEYVALGFGSHHWKVTDTAGRKWFATLDELSTRRNTATEPLDAVFGRLEASLATATALAECGLAFVVAPNRTRAGEVLARLTNRFSVALYPFLDGQSFRWGDFPIEHRRAMLDLIIPIHTAPAAALGRAMADDLSIVRRDCLEAALDDPSPDPGASGPYGLPAAEMVATHRVPVRRQLDRYDALAAHVRSLCTRHVLTHGEPHPGNTMLGPAGWLLIDWDTVLVAPAERDLWDLDPGDGSILAAYQRATGIAPEPAALEFYRLRWDLTDIALNVCQFRSPHVGDANDDKAFAGLAALLSGIPR